jgi:hypothetical protein
VGIAHRLDQLAQGVRDAPRPVGSSVISAEVEASLTRLEQLVEHLSEHTLPGTVDYARA